MLGWLAARNLKRIPVGQLYDERRFITQNDQTEIDIDPIVKHVVLVDPVNQDVPQVFKGDAIKTTKSGYLHVVGAGAAAAVNVIPSADEYTEIYSIMATMECDINAANRVSQIEIFDAGILGVPVDAHAQSHEMTLTAALVGTIYWGHGPVESMNTNNVMAWTVDTNILPSIFRPGTAVYYDSTNLQLGDGLAIDVVYRLLGA